MSDQRDAAQIRQARSSDVPGLVVCSAGLFAEDAGARDSSMNVDWPRDHAAQSFAAGIDDPCRLILVADLDGAVVGHLTGSVAEPTAMTLAKVATLVSMYVQPPHRREGIGGRLVENFMAWARQRGAGLAEVTAYASNTEAIGFYERSGFVPQAVTLRTGL